MDIEFDGRRALGKRFPYRGDGVLEQRMGWGGDQRRGTGLGCQVIQGKCLMNPTMSDKLERPCRWHRPGKEHVSHDDCEQRPKAKNRSLEPRLDRRYSRTRALRP